MKLRFVPKEKLRLKIFKDEEAERLMKKAMAIQKQAYSEFTSYSNIGQKQPPDTNDHNFKVVYVTSPNSFWVVVPGEDDSIQDEIQLALSTRQEDCIMQNLSEVKPGCVYLALYEDSWYRAKVERVERRSDVFSIVVWFIDYGNTEIITDLRHIMKLGAKMVKDHPPLIETPGCAMECSLMGVRPNPLALPKLSWDKESIKIFENLLDGCKVDPIDDIIRVVIYSVVPKNDRKLTTVTIKDPDGTILNNLMLNQPNARGLNIAMFEEEGILSQESNSTRKRFQVMANTSATSSR